MDPTQASRRKVRLAHAAWLFVSGGVVAAACGWFLSQPHGGFLDLTNLFVYGLSGWYAGAALLGTVLVWRKAKRLRGVVGFNLLAIAAVPALVAAGVTLHRAGVRAIDELTRARQASFGRIVRWRLDTGPNLPATLDADFEPGFTGKLRAVNFDGQGTAELDAVAGKTLTFTIGPVGSPGSGFAEGFRLYFDGIERQIYSRTGGSEYVEHGLLRRALPPVQPSERQLADEARRRAEECSEAVPPGRIEFIVTGVNQTGLFPGATVRARGCGRAPTGTTDAQGKAVLVLPPGDYRLGVSVAGDEAAEAGGGTRLRSGAAMTVRWGTRGAPPSGLFGRAFVDWGPKERELLGSTPLTLRRETGEVLEGVTDANGRFELAPPSGQYRLEASVKGTTVSAPVTVRYGRVELGDVGLSAGR